MEARRRQARSAMALVLLCTLASSLGCNPVGWGISHVKSLIHHHAHKPIVRERDDPRLITPPRTSAPAVAEQGAA